MRPMHPILFRIGHIELHSYGLMLAVGALFAIFRGVRVSNRYGVGESQVIDAGIIAMLCGLIGARLTYVALNWSDYAGDPLTIVAVWDGGLTFFGGLALDIVVLGFWARLNRVSVVAFADLAAPSLALGYGIARIGCFLNGCCYGVPTSLPWAVRFHAYGGDELTVPSHPVQIYSTITNMLIFWALVRLERRRPPAGSLFGSWMVLSSLERFAMEFLRRGVTATEIWQGMTQAQAVSLMLILAGSWVIHRSVREGRAHPGC